MAQQAWLRAARLAARLVVQRVARRALNKGLALGWTSWLEDYEEARRLKEQIDTAMMPEMKDTL